MSGRSSLLSHEASLGDATLRIAGGYALLAAVGVAAAVFMRGDFPIEHPAPWLHLREAGFPPHVVGLAAGAALAFVIVVATRLSMRFAWARRLERDLAPLAGDLGGGRIALLAALSSLGEEVFFRGLLATWLGVFASSILFGLVHQLRGPSRWIWIGWTAAAGLGFGAVYAATGSLVAPVVAHFLVNLVNLFVLRDVRRARG